ncbi:MAG TPA: hypothetical protein PLR49_14030 [Deltaproteobacteria bacterium]|nr:hypothetical protein [Deltaproteobacteria bacterium]
MRSIGDVIAVYIDDKPSVYARVESIIPDIKPHWFQVRLLFLSFPPQETTWILREEYLEGSPFTMKDIPVRIMALGKPGGEEPPSPGRKRKKPSPGEVVSFDKFRKKKKRGDGPGENGS